MLNNLVQKGKAFLEKGRKVKSRGIALTHVDQGYSANNREVSLLMKSDIDPAKLTVEVVKNLEQIQLKISMEEFLRKFFDMWYDDAELLTKLLGFQTQLEYDAEKEQDDEWLQDWNKRHQEYLDDKLESIAIINKAKSGEELTLGERFELIKTRKAFEDGCQSLDIEFEGDKPVKPTNTEAPVTPKVTPEVPVVKATQSSAGAKPENKPKENPVENVDITKSQAFIDLQKANEALNARLAEMQEGVNAAQEIIKAKKEADRAVAINKAASMPFVAEDQRDAVADLLMDAKSVAVVSVLEKAVALIADRDAALVAKDTEIEEIKKSFADGKPVGVDGELSPSATGADDAQERLNKAIEASKAKFAAQNA